MSRDSTSPYGLATKTNQGSPRRNFNLDSISARKSNEKFSAPKIVDGSLSTLIKNKKFPIKFDKNNNLTGEKFLLQSKKES